MIVFLDAATLGDDLNFDSLGEYGEYVIHQQTTAGQVLERCQNARIVITNKVRFSPEIMNRLPNLEAIVITATGTDNVDKVAALENNILVYNAVGYSTRSVVQQTMSMALYILMHPSYYDHFTRDGNWQKQPLFTHFKPFHEIAGKKWGIIGMGNIGKAVAKVVSAMGAEVQYYSTSGKNKQAGYQNVSFKDLLTSSDIVSIHAPLNEQTKNLITLNDLKQMKSEALLINMGRGGIVNEADLAEHLSQSPQFNAGLDVLVQEPPSAENPLLKHQFNNLFLSPHMAWASVEARQELWAQTLMNLKKITDSSRK